MSTSAERQKTAAEKKNRRDYIARTLERIDELNEDLDNNKATLEEANRERTQLQNALHKERESLRKATEEHYVPPETQGVVVSEPDKPKPRDPREPLPVFPEDEPTPAAEKGKGLYPDGWTGEVDG